MVMQRARSDRFASTCLECPARPASSLQSPGAAGQRPRTAARALGHWLLVRDASSAWIVLSICPKDVFYCCGMNLRIPPKHCNGTPMETLRKLARYR